MSYNLFLDDLRSHPKELYKESHYKEKALDESGNDLFENLEWVVVKNYEEFVSVLNEKGIPNYMSLDHDLADEHYTPKEYWDNFEESKKYQMQKYPNYKEKTGLHCLEYFLKQYGNKAHDVKIGFHSANPVGVQLMENLFYQFVLNQHFKKNEIN